MSNALELLLDTGPVGVVAKISAVLLAAVLLNVGLSRASAAIRHLVWLAAIGACLGVAFFSPVAPRLTVPLVREIAIPSAHRVSPIASTRVDAELGPLVTSLAPALVPEPIATRVAPSTWRVDGVVVAIAIWLVGCLVLLGRCVLGHVAVARLVSRAFPLDTSDFTDAIANAASGAGVSRGIRVLISDDLATPVTTGWLRPVILLPPDSDLWTAERRHVVLVHELAHIARGDYLSQLVATIASALFWFHPLVWLAAARLRAEAEHAADDRVLGSGTSGIDYAGHLLDLARVESAPHLSAAVAVGMVRASRLEGRFRAMLETNRSRVAVSARLQATAMSATLAAMIPLAGVRAVTTSVASPTIVSAVERTMVPASAVASRLANLPQQVGATEDSSFEKTIAATAGERLTLELETGAAIVVRGWDEARVRVRGSLGGRDWRDTRVTLERVNGGVRLRSEFENSGQSRSSRHAFELWVPRKMNVEVASSGGSVSINGVEGEFRGHTGGGAIEIESATGRASLTTGGGNVSVVNSTLGGHVSTGGGSVSISNVRGGLTGSSGSGPVVATTSGGATTVGVSSDGGYGVGRTIGSGASSAYGVAGRIYSTSSGSGVSAGGGWATGVNSTNGVTTIASSTTRGVGTNNLSYSKAGGDIVLDEVLDGGRFTTGGGRISIGSTNGVVVVSTGGGGIELPRVSGSVYASTGAGDVRITVVNADGTEQTVDVFTGKGDVVLDLPSSLDARFELEAAYTETHARSRIDSDFSLEQTETQDWDASAGTPRRYVRARGSIGSGKGLIRVRAVNGDITVRRTR